MKRTLGVGITVAAIVAMPMTELSAQERQRARRAGNGPSVEMIMQMRERLELTEAQLADLDAIRAESVARRSAEQADMAEMRSLLAAGQIRRSEMMAFMEERRDANAGVGDEVRERIDAVLTEEQRGQVEQLRRRGRSMRRGPAMGRRGPPGQLGRRGRGTLRRPGMGARRPGLDRRARSTARLFWASELG